MGHLAQSFPGGVGYDCLMSWRPRGINTREFKIVEALPGPDSIPIHPDWLIKHQRSQNKGYYHAVTRLYGEVWGTVMVTDDRATWRATLMKYKGEGTPNSLRNYERLCNWDCESFDEWDELWTRICERPLEVLTVSVL